MSSQAVMVEEAVMAENVRARAMPAATLEGQVFEGMQMKVFTAAFHPFEIMWASDDWLRFCGFEAGEVVDQSLKCIQGPCTCFEDSMALAEAATRFESKTVTLTNYTKHGVPFTHTVIMEPLMNSFDQPVMYMARSVNITSAA